MRRRSRHCLVCIAYLSLALQASAMTRTAIVIGTNRGTERETVLEYAESDAKKMARTFVEVGAVTSDALTLVTGRSVDVAQQALATARRSDEVWVFISGHADAEGVHIDGAVWSWRDLRARLDALPAARRIVFIDACNSGALLTAKGISLENQLDLSVRSNMKGLVLVVSSGANELSYESRRLGSSPFAHFLASGLRGAADLDRDGRVTLAEAYSFLYSRTVAASLGGSGGPQHPEQAGWYSGNGQWELVRRVGERGQLRLSDRALGVCYVLDPEEVSVIAELRASDAAPLTLPTGRYRVRCAGTKHDRVADLELGMATTSVEALPFRDVDPEAMLARGKQSVGRFRVGLKPGVVVLEAGLRGAAGAALEYGQEDFGVTVDVGVWGKSHLLNTATLSGRLPWWNALGSRLDVGLVAGYAVAQGHGVAPLIGTAMRVSWDLGSSGRWFLRQDVLRLLPIDQARVELPLLTLIGVDWSLSP